MLAQIPQIAVVEGAILVFDFVDCFSANADDPLVCRLALPPICMLRNSLDFLNNAFAGA